MGSLRRRQLLLSLKYSTIEASFSVPMLQLTLGHLPFTIGFAEKALGWRAAGIGFLAATPFLAALLQVGISFLLQRRLSLHAIVRATFGLNALPWFLVALFPILAPGARDVLFAAVVLTSALGNSICGVAWSSSMSELVPLSIRGRYFGRRNMIYGFWALLAVLLAGQIADRYGYALTVFAAIYAVAAVSRLVGLYFFSRMTFPPVVMETRPGAMTLRGFMVPLRDRNFLAVLAFNGLLGMFLLAGIPFYNLFVLDRPPVGLGRGLGDLVLMNTVASLAGLLSVNTWGPLSDRFGVKPLLFWCIGLWSTIGTGLWLLAGPERRQLTWAIFALQGFMWALCQLLQFNLMLKMAPPEHRTYYISTYYTVTNALAAAGPLLGGWVLTRVPATWGRVFGQPLTRYQVVIVGSLLLCLGSLAILRRVREPAEGSVLAVARHVRSSAEVNPLLMLLSAAQGLFNGRAFEAMIRGSRRTLRRQTNALAAVGEELAREGWRALRWRFARRKGTARRGRTPEEGPGGKGARG